MEPPTPDYADRTHTGLRRLSTRGLRRLSDGKRVTHTLDGRRSRGRKRVALTRDEHHDRMKPHLTNSHKDILAVDVFVFRRNLDRSIMEK